MAQMYPTDGPVEGVAESERRLYDLFRDALGPDFYIIHSANWHATDEHGRVSDGEADFVVVHPLHGVLVLEVKGGGVIRNGVTRRWSTVNARGQRSAIKDPFKQAMRSMHVLVRTLRAAPLTKSFASSYRLGYGVWLPDVRWPRTGEGMLQGLDELALDAQHLSDPGAALSNLYRHFSGMMPPQRLTDEAVDALIELLTPTIVAKSSLAVAIAGEEPRIRQLTQAQYERLRTMWLMHRQLAIPGAAGTGKTVIALEMAWRLAEEGMDVLLLCANQQLADWLAYRVEQDPRPAKPRVDVRSVKSLVWTLAKTTGWREREVESLRITSADHQKTFSSILSGAIRKMEQRGEPMPYDAILVDEAQDIEHALAVPIQKLLRDHRDGFFYYFYDEAQRVDLSGTWSFRPAGAKPYLPLTANCRNTRTIYDLMARYNPALSQLAFEGPAGRPVEYVCIERGRAADAGGIHSGGATEEEVALTQTLDRLLGDQGGLRPEDVLVITCRSEAKSQWYRSESRTVGRHMLRWLRRGERDGCVPLATIRSAKGLEYKVVILAELDGLAEEKRREALLYVAISRAMHHLVVLGCEQDFAGRQPSLWSA